MILKNILQINQILSKVKTTLDFQLDWKIAECICSSNQHIEFYNSKINEIFKKYGELDENGNLICIDNGIKIQADKIDEFSEKINELDSVEIDFNFDITVEELSKCNLEISDLVFLKQNILQK